MSTVREDTPSVKSQISVSFTSFSDQISKSNKSRLLISILSKNSKEKQKHIIELVLERFSFLSLSNSSECE